MPDLYVRVQIIQLFLSYSALQVTLVIVRGVSFWAGMVTIRRVLTYFIGKSIMPLPPSPQYAVHQFSQAICA